MLLAEKCVSSEPLVEFWERVHQVRGKLVDEPLRLALYERVISTLDPEAVAAFQERQRRRLELSAEGKEKYADIPRWLAKKTSLALHLGLDTPPSRSILDIGSGGGYFLALCKLLGHSGLGVDVEDPFYSELCNLLGVARRVSPVLRQRPLSDLGRRFDLIIVTAQTFDYAADESRGYWKMGDWVFFIEDIRNNQLTSGGSFYLRLNLKRLDLSSAHGEPSLSSVLLKWCEENGAVVDRSKGAVEFKARALGSAKEGDTSVLTDADRQAAKFRPSVDGTSCRSQGTSASGPK